MSSEEERSSIALHTVLGDNPTYGGTQTHNKVTDGPSEWPHYETAPTTL